MRDEHKNDPDFNRGFTLVSLAGLDSERAWQLRDKNKNDPSLSFSIVSSLTGLDSEKAWQFRDEYKNDPRLRLYLVDSITGLDSDEAWKMREEFKKYPTLRESVALSLRGLDSDLARKMSEEFKDDYYKKTFSNDYFIWETYLVCPFNKKNFDKNNDDNSKLELFNLLNKFSQITLSKKETKENEETKENNETKYLTEEKILDKLEEFIEQGVSKVSIAQGLAGLDSDRAWEMRQDLIDKGCSKGSILLGLAGLDSDRAWEMRKNLIQQVTDKRCIIHSLAGLDSDRAWKLRNEYKNDPSMIYAVISSLTGLDSRKSWEMREEFKNDPTYKGWIVKSLTGLDSRKAWEMREECKNDPNVDRGFILIGLAGLDSERAWQLREELKNDADFYIKGCLIEGLTGLDSYRAWKIREEQLKWCSINKGKPIGDPSILETIAWSLNGLDSDKARKMREEFKGYLYESTFSNGFNSFYVWQPLNTEKFKKNGKTSQTKTKKDKTGNFNKKSYLEDIDNYFKKFSTGEDKISMTQVSGLSSIIREVPKEFLRTMSAKRDHRAQSTRLMNKIFPSAYKEIERGKYGRKPASAKDYLTPKETNELFGRDQEGNKIDLNEEVLRFREPVTGFIVFNMYSKVIGDNKWSSSFEFSVARNEIKKAKEITITLPNIGNKVSLPKFIDSNIITERTKGIKNGKEFSLTPEINSFGGGLVLDTKKAEEIVYSLEIDEIPRVMRDIKSNEYDNYKNKFLQNNGKEIVSPIVELPDEIELFIEKIKDKDPRERVESIESFVRSICHYDMKNKEVTSLKNGKSFEELLSIMEDRMYELKEVDSGKSLSGKKYAGVCADFAVLTTAILRKAGFMSGVLTGFNLSDSESSYVKNAHATSFVVWPNRRGENCIFSVDGTPSGIEGISTMSIEEKKSLRESLMGEIKKEGEEKLEEIKKILDSYDEESIEKLTNGQLEEALNNILDYGVNKESLRTITSVFNAYWYSPIKKLDLDQIESKIIFTSLLDDTIREVKEEGDSGEIENSGGKLFEVINEFIKRFSKEDKNISGFNQAKKIRDLSSSFLNKDQLKAMTVIISYLEAKKVK
jgi:hypothetical protein